MVGGFGWGNKSQGRVEQCAVSVVLLRLMWPSSSLLALDHGGRSHHKNFKYTPDDMERMIGELFDGRVIASEAPKGKNLF